MALEKLKRDRTIPRKALIDKISGFRGTEWDLSVAANDLEADGLAVRFAVTLKIAGWVQVAWNGPAPTRRIPGPTEPVGPLPTSFGGIFTRGMLITVDPAFSAADSPQMKAAHTLAEALADLDVDCAGVVVMEQSANKNAVHVVVSHK